MATDTRVRREARTLVGAGYVVEALCWDRQAKRPTNEVLDGCEVHNLQLGETTSLLSSKTAYLLSALVFQLVIIYVAFRALERSRRIIIHANDFNTLVGGAISKRLFWNRISLIYDSHEFTPGVYLEWYGKLTSGVVSACERLAANNVDGILAANDAIAGYLARLTGVEAEAVYNCPSLSEIPEISKVEARRRLGLDDRFTMIFSGRVRQDYDVAMVVDAARSLTSLRPKFLFTGPPETLSPLSDLVAREGLEALFEFRGWIPFDELLVTYKASDLCFAVTTDLGPNTRVLTPIKLFESMACGLPVIVRTETLAAQIVNRAGCGFTANGTADFIMKMESMIQNRASLTELGNAGTRAFVETYNWESMERRLLAVYREAVSND